MLEVAVVLVVTLCVLLVCAGLCRTVLRRPAPNGSLPSLPDADRPPPDLRPLVPSPRVVDQEVARGLRDLQLWLADQSG